MRKVRASSILEVTVAMVLIAGMFTLSIMIYLNIVSSSPQFRKLKFESYASQIAEEVIASKAFEDSSWSKNQILFTKTINTHKNNNQVVVVRIVGKDALGKIIVNYKRIVYVPV